MLSVLSHRVYARLFAAQVIALVGTGLMTVALGLLAYDLAGAQAGVVLGMALTIKMVAYVVVSPVAGALAERLPRKVVLIGANVVRAAVVVALPFVDAVWQIYGLIFVLQAASAAFTPAFQALIPEILEKEGDYTRALSLSRLAYDLENLISPALAAALLLVMSFHGLFVWTVVGFGVAGWVIARTPLPRRREVAGKGDFRDRVTRGVRIYLATPRLRGLWALNMTAASAGAFVLVNTVVITRVTLGGGEVQVAYAMAAFGGGSMVAAVCLPRLLERIPDRLTMITAAAALTAGVLGTGLWWSVLGALGWGALLAIWGWLGLFYSAVLTPSGRLLRRSARPEDRPAVFAAQFALSHACWLVAYPLAGWAGQVAGMSGALLILGGIGLFGVLIALWAWPVGDPTELTHSHPDLPLDHPHLRANGGFTPHRHAFVIDAEHKVWPARS